MPAPQQVEARARRWPLALAITGLAAAVLLAFVVPDLLVGEQEVADRRLTENASATPRPSGYEHGVTIPLAPERRDVASETHASAPGPTDPSPVTDPSADATTSGPTEPDPSLTTTARPETAGHAPQVNGDTGKHSDTHADSGGDRPPAASLSQQIDEGCQMVRNADARRGVEILLKAHDRKPGDQRLVLCLADGNSKLGKHQAAANFYVRLLEDNVRNRRALLGAAQSYESLNERATARIYYERLRQQEPKNPSARAFFAEEDDLGATP